MTRQDIYDGIKIALTVVGGIGGVIALVVAYRRQRFAEREHVRAEAATVREDTRLYTERFRTASEQLGSERAAVRLAGAYAMASLADDWLTGQQTCIDVLCAYLRMPYTPPIEGGDPSPAVGMANQTAVGGAATTDATETDELQRGRQQERQVRHTIFRLIGAHLRPEATVSWCGRDLDFTGATVDGADFRAAVFSGGQVIFAGATFCGGLANFAGATFSGGEVYFTDVAFCGHVNFADATFSGGLTNLAGATFSGGLADFAGANFSNSQVCFTDVTFSGSRVDFRDATFSGGRIDFTTAKFLGGEVNFQSTFSGGQVSFLGAIFLSGGVYFMDATFSGGVVSFNRARFSGGNVSFHRAAFSGGTLAFPYPGNWTVPPMFDAWPGGPPEGVLLPPEDDDRKASAAESKPESNDRREADAPATANPDAGLS